MKLDVSVLFLLMTNLGNSMLTYRELDLRANRLELLRSVAATMNRVADIGKLAQ